MPIRYLSGVNVDSNTLVVDAVNDRVGIGTATPAAKLSLGNNDFMMVSVGTSGKAGILFFEAGTSTATDVQYGAKIFYDESLDVLQLSTRENNVDKLGIAIARATGNVGIGTTNPTTALHVIGLTQIVESGNTAFYGGNFVRVFNDQNFNIRNVSGTTIANISVSGPSYFNGGNVGIGTTAPTSILHIDGIDPFVRINNVNSANNQGIKISYNYSETHGLHLLYNANAAASFIDNTYPITVGQAWGDIYFRQNSGSGMVTRMTIKADGGNVGIGTTAPTKKLHVVGAIRTEGGEILANTNQGGIGWVTIEPTSAIEGQIALNVVNSSGASFASIRGNGNAYFSGNVGIGTTAPGAKLHVDGGNAIFNNGSADTILAIKTDAAGLYDPIFQMGSGQNTIASEGFEIWYANNVGDVHLSTTYNDAAASIRFHTATGASKSTSNERMIITGAGNVGIGTTSPNAKLEVVGATIVRDSPATNDWGLRLQNTNTGGWGVSQFFNIYGYASSPASDFSALQIRADYPGYGRISFVVKEQAQSSGLESLVLRGNGQVYMNAGNVGINSTSPNAKLNVRGTDGSGSVTPQEDVLHVGGNELGGVGGYAGIRIGGAGNTSYGAYIRGVKTTAYGNYWNTALTFSVTRTNTETTIDEVMRITSAGNVGIGTTDPQGKLDVTDGVVSVAIKSTLAVESSSNNQTLAQISFYKHYGLAIGSAIRMLQSGGTGNYPQAHLAFFTNDGSAGWSTPTERMRIKDGGNVGIGTADPSYKLEVNGLAAADRYILNSVPTNSFQGSLTAIAGDSTYNILAGPANGPVIRARWSGGTANRYLEFGQTDNGGNYTAGVRIVEGNVGIGTTAPSAKLEVLSAVSATPITNGVLRIVGTGTNPATGAGGGLLLAQQDSAGSYVNYASITGRRVNNAANNIVDLDFNTGSPSDSVALATRMTITGNAGNVGIGTTSPNEKLSVAGNIETTGLGKIGFNVSDSYGSFPHYGLGYAGGANVTNLAGYFGLSFGTTGTERLRITSAGNVGIGTTAPANKLEVDGGSSAVTLRVSTTNTGSGVSALVLSNSSKSAFNDGVNIAHGGGFTNITDLAGTNIMSWDLSNTRVGIGTTTPGAKLDVNGNVHISNAGGALYFNRPQGATVGAIGWRASDDSFYVGGLPGYGENAGNDVRVRGFGANLILGTAGSDRVFITPAGNVGIGTTSPISGQSTPLTLASADGFVGITLLGTAAYAHTWQLYASGDGGSNKLFGIYDRTNGAYRLVTTSSGNVGIGTTAPGTKLEITTADSATTVYPLSLTNPNNQAGDGGGAGIRFSTSSGPGGNGNEALKYSSIEAFDVNNFGSNSGLSFTVSNGYTKSKAIVINRFGGVGIGTTSPAYKLDVVGVGRLLSVGIIQASSNSDTPNIAFTNNGTSFTWGTIGGLLQGDGDGALFFNTKIGASVTEKMRITSAGNVGIGTTSPISALHILGNQFRIEDNDPTITLKRNVAGAFGGHIDWLTNDNTLGFQIANNALISAAVLEFNHSGVNRMVIKSDGNVGIGTTAPSELLEVVGNIRANVSNGGGFMLTGASASGLVRAGATGLALRTDTADRLTIDNSGAATFSSSVTATQFITGGTPSNTAGFTNSFYAEGSFPSLTLSNTGTNTGKYTLGVTNGNFGIWNNASSSYNLFISAGNVGIGTTAPSEKLHVNTATGTLASLDNGDGAIWSTLSNTKSIGLSSGTNYALGSNFTWIKLTGGASGNIIFAANNEAMRITSAGNVGIGTTAPGAKLHIDSAIGNDAIQISDAAGSVRFSIGQEASYTGNYINTRNIDMKLQTYLAGGSGGNIIFQTQNNGTSTVVERMRITSAGNVGIGTTAPKSKLQILGPTLITNNENSYAVWVSDTGDDTKALLLGYDLVNDIGVIQAVDQALSWKSISIASNGGNVGIGTTAPSSRLEVRSDSSTNVVVSTFTNPSNAANTTKSASIDLSLSDTVNTIKTVARFRAYTDNTNVITGGLAFDIRTADAAPNEVMRITSAGNVGIGTTAPSGTYGKLTVAGGIHITNDNNAKLEIGRYSVGVPNSYIKLGANSNSLRFTNNTDVADLMELTNSGNLGLGVTPSQASVGINRILDIGGASVPGIVLHSTNNSSEMAIGTGGDGLIISASGSANAANDNIIRFFTAATNSSFAISEKVRITAAGNVLINTTTDSGFKLDVNGTGRFSGGASVPLSLVGTTFSGIEYTRGATLFGFIGTEDTTSGGMRYNSIAGNFEHKFYNNSNLSLTLASTGAATFSNALQVAGQQAAANYGGTGLNFDFTTGNIGRIASVKTTSGGSQLQFFVYNTSGTDINALSIASTGAATFSSSVSAATQFFGTSNITDPTTATTLATTYSLNGNSATNPFGIGLAAIRNSNYDMFFQTGPTNGGGYRFYRGTSELVTILNNGNVGIGTTAPGNRLEVRSATSNSFFTSFTPSAGSGFISIYQDSNNHPSIYGANASGTATIVLNTSGVSYLTGGNVLIGATADAGFKLDVNGTGRFSGVVYSASRLMVGITSDQTYASIFIGGDITTGGNQYALLTDPQLSGTNNYGVFANARIKASHAATNAYGVFIVNNERISGATIANNYGLYIQNQTNGSTLNYAVYSEGGTSFFNGNVGIGTTSPGARLDVRTSSTNLSLRLGNANGTNWDFYSYNDSNLYINNAVGTLFTITNTGNVGIGTAAPSEKLEVSGAISATGAVAGLSAQGHSTTLAVVGGTSVLYAVDWGAEFKPLSIQGKTISLETGTGSTSARITIDNSGNVGIGTTAPGAKLDIVSTGAGSEGLRVDGASGGFAFVVKGGSDYTSHIRAGATIGVNYVTTPPSNGLIVEGNVGIGTTAPSEKLHVDGSTLVTYNNSFQSTNSVGNKAILARVSPTSGIVNYAEYATAANLNGFVIGSDDARVKGNIATDSLELITNTSTRMTILSSGNVGINTTTPGSTLHVIGDVLIQTGSLGVGVNPNATDGRIDASNDIVAFSTSDRRLKENITPITNALEKVRSLTGVEFDWKEETKSVHGYEGHDVGVIAQDVQAVLPEAVRTNDSGYLSVRYEKMIALLVEAMKEQQAQIDELKAQINDSPR